MTKIFDPGNKPRNKQIKLKSKGTKPKQSDQTQGLSDRTLRPRDQTWIQGPNQHGPNLAPQGPNLGTQGPKCRYPRTKPNTLGSNLGTQRPNIRTTGPILQTKILSQKMCLIQILQPCFNFLQCVQLGFLFKQNNQKRLK